MSGSEEGGWRREGGELTMCEAGGEESAEVTPVTVEVAGVSATTYSVISIAS